MSKNSLFYKVSEVPGYRDLINGIPNDSTKLTLINYTTLDNQKYKIIRYDKPYLSIGLLSTYGFMRSIVLNNKNIIVGFSPPKSIPTDLFRKIYETRDDIIAEEFVEGTMINLFWDTCSGINGSWNISTRNAVGGEMSFCKNTKLISNKKTCRMAFLEACQDNNLEMSTLDKKYCYSFVLQHEENQTVIPFYSRQLYLVSVYEIINTENGTVNVFPINKYDIYSLFVGTTVKFPYIYRTWNTYDDLTHLYASENTPYYILGVMIYNTKTGERCKMRNPEYSGLKKYQKMSQKYLYYYLSLRKENMLHNYFSHYPYRKKSFLFFKERLFSITDALYKNYVSFYIEKTQDGLFSEKFKSHMLTIHQKYLDELKPKGLCVKKNAVVDYINSLSVETQFYLLNYASRNREIDYSKNLFYEDYTRSVRTFS